MDHNGVQTRLLGTNTMLIKAGGLHLGKEREPSLLANSRIASHSFWKMIISKATLEWRPTRVCTLHSLPDWVKAERWLMEIKESHVMKEVFSAFQKKELAENRIRIAVLDTGYDKDAVFFNRDRKRRLRGWRDYVEDQPYPMDEDGHGTHVLSVLMKVAPAADIFVARVTRDTPDLQHATANIARAIEWAWKDCQANVITMSFGFDKEIYVGDKPVISNAILKALLKTNQRILFFAAAANDGGNRAEMFPASDMNVFSIRGTDDYGWAQRFNPPPDYNSATCFMTLGVDVPGASLTRSEHEGADVCKSGTSVATPIAAGIAALLLGYARMHEESLREKLGATGNDKLVKLWTRAGMSTLFEKIATEMLEKWSYLGIHKFTGLEPDLRLSMMALAAMEAKG
ncbi:peptidase S8/S53 domain-containing protein [Xylaria intraflava]|nr:peptidase S8/S53 domain-containing protein [Xylaria intraflava]